MNPYDPNEIAARREAIKKAGHARAALERELAALQARLAESEARVAEIAAQLKAAAFHLHDAARNIRLGRGEDTRYARARLADEMAYRLDALLAKYKPKEARDAE